MLPCLESVLLPRVRFVRCHPFDGLLCVGEDGDPFRGRVSSRSRLQRAREGSALRIVGLLVVPHVRCADWTAGTYIIRDHPATTQAGRTRVMIKQKKLQNLGARRKFQKTPRRRQMVGREIYSTQSVAHFTGMKGVRGGGQRLAAYVEMQLFHCVHAPTGRTRARQLHGQLETRGCPRHNSAG